jgi:hypothetical protein
VRATSLVCDDEIAKINFVEIFFDFELIFYFSVISLVNPQEFYSIFILLVILYCDIQLKGHSYNT